MPPNQCMAKKPAWAADDLRRLFNYWSATMPLLEASHRRPLVPAPSQWEKHRQARIMNGNLGEKQPPILRLPYYTKSKTLKMSASDARSMRPMIKSIVAGRIERENFDINDEGLI